MYEKLNNLLILLCRTISTRKLYFTEHPKVKTLSIDFIEKLRDFCREARIDKLFIGIVEGNLVFEGKNLVGPSIVGRQLILFAEKLHCGGFSFQDKTSLTEFTAFLNLATDLKQPTGSLKLSRQLLTTKNIHNIEVAQHYSGSPGPLGRDQKAVWHGQDTGDFIHSPTLIYQALFDAVAQAHGDVAGGNDIDIDSTRSVSEYMLHYTRAQFSDLMQHVYYPDYDSYTVGHSVRVAALAVFLAHSFRWNEESLLAIGTAGLLHDIGKSRITDEILYKPGKLNKEEYDAIMRHSQIGAEILLGQKNTTPLDIAAAWGHHIRNDGTGYPEQPKWAVRHPFTSLLQICDAFEALTAVRPYKPLLSPHMAYSIMLTDRGGFHPSLLASFINTIGIYPPGNRVLISNGSQGIVLSTDEFIDRPEVRVTHSRNGEILSPGDQYTLKLSAAKNRNLQIDRILLFGD
ncbi:MAG: HD domain-containing phosphohydrolase [Desulfopila sp.]|jgi:putative nucleotidyltransferase with HDIG domain|nr:HD domain-containing phosphohydrolase [Desulfopila sp.]